MLLIALLTGLLQFPNIYTRTNASEVIKKLFSQCGPMDENDLCAYNKTAERPDQQYHDTEALYGVWRAVWQLVLAMLLKMLLTIFTFGMKVKLVCF